MLFMQFSYGFTLFGGGYSDVYKEVQEYICADAAAHSLKAVEINDWDTSNYAPYYGLEIIPTFAREENYGVVYITPLRTNGFNMLRSLIDAGLDETNVLKIAAPNGKYIWKAYPQQKE
jgi:hypothetical protein